MRFFQLFDLSSVMPASGPVLGTADGVVCRQHILRSITGGKLTVVVHRRARALQARRTHPVRWHACAVPVLCLLQGTPP